MFRDFWVKMGPMCFPGGGGGEEEGGTHIGEGNRNFLPRLLQPFTRSSGAYKTLHFPVGVRSLGPIFNFSIFFLFLEPIPADFG